MSSKFLTGLNLNNKQVNALADGTAATDAVTLQQLQAMVRGLAWKSSARAASTANVTVATPGASIDGVTLAANDRVLLKNQTAAAENGLYVWAGAATPLTRASDMNTAAQASGATVLVTEGTVNADKAFTMTTDAVTLGTTSLVWVQFGGGGSVYTAGSGLSLTASAFAVVAGPGIIADGTNTRIDTSVVARKFAASCVVTTNPQTFAHGLGTADISVMVREGAVEVYPDVSVDATNITVDYGAAPTAGQYRVIAVG